MEISKKISAKSLPKNDIDAYAMSELHKAMLQFWEKLKELSSMPEPPSIEVTAAIEEFAITWQMITGIQDDVNQTGGSLMNTVSLPQTFGRLLFKRLRLQYLEFGKEGLR